MFPIDETFELTPGQEWFSQPINLQPDEQVRIIGSGTNRFYLDIVPSNRVEAWKAPRPTPSGDQIQRGPWPFQFGSDRLSWDRVYTAPVGGDYTVVVRLGVFNQAGRFRVRIDPA